MMIYQMFAVRDVVADCYGQPFFSPSAGQATRGFVDEINRAAPENQLYKHAEDFELFHLGTYDDANALFEILPSPVRLLRGADCKVRS